MEPGELIERLRKRAKWEGKRNVGRTLNARAMDDAADALEAALLRISELEGEIEDLKHDLFRCMATLNTEVNVALMGNRDA